MTALTKIFAGIIVWLIAIGVILWSIVASVVTLLVALLIAIVSLPNIIIEQFQE